MLAVELTYLSREKDHLSAYSCEHYLWHPLQGITNLPLSQTTCFKVQQDKDGYLAFDC